MESFGTDRVSVMQLRSPTDSSTTSTALTFPHAEKLGLTEYGRLSHQQSLDYHNNKLAWDHILSLEAILMPKGVGPFSKGPAFGVIKIDNAPYGCTRNEVISVLTKDVILAQYPQPSAYYGVYFPLDMQNQRATGVIFVEVQDMAEAVRQVRIFMGNKEQGRRRRIGNREVSLTVSDQASLMKVVFDRTSCVKWDDSGRPIVYPPADASLDGFKGFLHGEDLKTLVSMAQGTAKYARTQVAKEYPQRPYEALLAILRKYPCHAWEIVPFHECNLLYDFAVEMASALRQQIGTNHQWAHVLHRGLLNEIISAVCAFHGFSTAAKQQFAARSG
ncbi:hypothetical protein H2199_008510 [Coniosporium tulheliwenetii]|uniref:Uncharacterized protein n=1 Tax=Coniosporium tulheliwenetii TaxID=3383036 RepID=A0ACC2YJN7_9PEZI|nr:hypothetical protein H2199_008510 [Cladosporium sp. JES 115]